MAKPEIKKGDVVVLKSGSPEMTVAEVGIPKIGGINQLSACCEWFDREGNTQQKWFAVVVLSKKLSEEPIPKKRPSFSFPFKRMTSTWKTFRKDASKTRRR